jgi:S1-C subfamily serine protease
VASLVPSGSVRANPEVFQRVLRSTAWVRSPIDKEKTSIGSGALVSVKKRLLVTNFHVVENRPDVLVFFPVYRNGEAINDPDHYLKNVARLGIRGTVIHTDSKHDLAVIQLEKLPEGVRALPLARQAPRPGETIHSIGNSGFKDGTLWRYSKGEVRQVYRFKEKSLPKDSPRQVPIDARIVESQIPTNKGDSGGPVVNDRAELVAITQGFITNEQLITLGIEVSEVRKVLANVANAERTSASSEERAAQPSPEPEDLPVDEPPATRPPTPAGKPSLPQRPVQVSPGCPKHCSSGGYSKYYVSRGGH